MPNRSKKRYHWEVSQQQIDTYIDLLRRQNITRRNILRNRGAVLREPKREKSFRIPSLVVPEHAKITKNRGYYGKLFTSYKEYREVIKEKKRLYLNYEKSFYKSTYKRNILEAWKDGIETALDEQGSFQTRPENLNGTYSLTQIEESGEIGEYMKLYNRIHNMAPERFMKMYDRGVFLPFKYLYNEMVGSYQSNYLEEQKELIDSFDSLYE